MFIVGSTSNYDKGHNGTKIYHSVVKAVLPAWLDPGNSQASKKKKIEFIYHETKNQTGGNFIEGEPGNPSTWKTLTFEDMKVKIRQCCRDMGRKKMDENKPKEKITFKNNVIS